MIEIKIINPEELTEDVLDILTDAFKHPRLDLKEAKERMKIRKRHSFHTFIIKLDGQVIGTASVLIETKLFGELARIAHVEDVAIRKDLNGFGYGRQLMEYVKEFCKKQRCRKIVLYCSNYNTAFYKKLGFRHTSNLMRIDLD